MDTQRKINLLKTEISIREKLTIEREKLTIEREKLTIEREKLNQTMKRMKKLENLEKLEKLEKLEEMSRRTKKTRETQTFLKLLKKAGVSNSFLTFDRLENRMKSIKKLLLIYNITHEGVISIINNILKDDDLSARAYLIEQISANHSLIKDLKRSEENIFSVLKDEDPNYDQDPDFHLLQYFRTGEIEPGTFIFDWA